MSYFQEVYSVLSAHKLNFEQTQRNGKCHFETFVMFEGGNRQEIHGRKIPKLFSAFLSESVGKEVNLQAIKDELTKGEKDKNENLSYDGPDIKIGKETSFEIEDSLATFGLRINTAPNGAVTVVKIDEDTDFFAKFDTDNVQ